MEAWGFELGGQCAVVMIVKGLPPGRQTCHRRRKRVYKKEVDDNCSKDFACFRDVRAWNKKKDFFFVVNERRDETRYHQMMREHPSSITISIALGWLAGLWLSGVD